MAERWPSDTPNPGSSSLSEQKERELIQELIDISTMDNRAQLAHVTEALQLARYYEQAIADKEKQLAEAREKNKNKNKEEERTGKKESKN